LTTEPTNPSSDSPDENVQISKEDRHKIIDEWLSNFDLTYDTVIDLGYQYKRRSQWIPAYKKIPLSPQHQRIIDAWLKENCITQSTVECLSEAVASLDRLFASAIPSKLTEEPSFNLDGSIVSSSADQDKNIPQPVRTDNQIVTEYLNHLGIGLADVVQLAFENREREKNSLPARRKLRSEGEQTVDHKTDVDLNIATEAKLLGLDLGEPGYQGRRGIDK